MVPSPLTPVPPLNLVLNTEGLNEYLARHGLKAGEDNVPIDAVLLQPDGTAAGLPAVLIVVVVDGKRVVAKTTLRLLNTAVAALMTAAFHAVQGEASGVGGVGRRPGAGGAGGAHGEPGQPGDAGVVVLHVERTDKHD